MNLGPTLTGLVSRLFKDFAEQLTNPEWDPLADLKKRHETEATPPTEPPAPEPSLEEVALAKIEGEISYGEWKLVEEKHPEFPSGSQQERNYYSLLAMQNVYSRLQDMRLKNVATGMEMAINNEAVIKKLYTSEGSELDFIPLVLYRKWSKIYKERCERQAAEKAAEKKARDIENLLKTKV